MPCACGLPEPRADHAVAMARFARNIVSKMCVLVKDLETVLGPDAADLELRVGIHNGPVAADVLHGDRARFQACWCLFWILLCTLAPSQELM